MPPLLLCLSSRGYLVHPSAVQGLPATPAALGQMVLPALHGSALAGRLEVGATKHASAAQGLIDVTRIPACRAGPARLTRLCDADLNELSKSTVMSCSQHKPGAVGVTSR